MCSAPLTQFQALRRPSRGRFRGCCLSVYRPFIHRLIHSVDEAVDSTRWGSIGSEHPGCMSSCTQTNMSAKPPSTVHQMSMFRARRMCSTHAAWHTFRACSGLIWWWCTATWTRGLHKPCHGRLARDCNSRGTTTVCHILLLCMQQQYVLGLMQESASAWVTLRCIARCICITPHE